MGVVYEAYDPFIDRRVAIKVGSTFGADTLSAEHFRELFFNEARAAGKLTHPHIVSLYDAMVELEKRYLVMEYVDGPTVKQFCRKPHLLPLDDALRISLQCANALDYAHRNGVIHRDIKPGNIMVANGAGAKIADFGIARVEGGTDPANPGSVSASTYYTAPELLSGKPATPQSDLFSLGAVLYELVAGARPFQGVDEISTFFKIVHESPPPLREFRSNVPEALEGIIGKCLAKKATERYCSGIQMAAELSAAFEHLRHAEEEIRLQEKLDALKRVSFFKDFTSSELGEVLRKTQWCRYEAGSVIISEGAIEDCFYVLISGAVAVKKHGKPLALLGQGNCFGEMAYFGGNKRTATIEATKEAVLMRIQTSVIDQTALTTQLKFHKSFSSALVQRLSDTSELLTTDTGMMS